MHTTDLMLSLRNLFFVPSSPHCRHDERLFESCTWSQSYIIIIIIQSSALQQSATSSSQKRFFWNTTAAATTAARVNARILIKFSSREISGNKSLFRGYAFFCKGFLYFFFFNVRESLSPHHPPNPL